MKRGAGIPFGKGKGKVPLKGTARRTAARVLVEGANFGARDSKTAERAPKEG